MGLSPEIVSGLITSMLPSGGILPTVNNPFMYPKPGKNSMAELMNTIHQLKSFEIQLKVDALTYDETGSSSNEYGYLLQFPNQQIRDVAYTIVDKNDSNDEKAYKILMWVRDNIPYQTDEKNYGVPEFWALPTETLQRGSGDCISINEEIYVKGGLKKVRDLQIGDLVLSYDFEAKKFCYKPIIKIWEKGKKKVCRLHFRNGGHVDVSKDHKFPIRKYQKDNKGYKEQKVENIDLTRWWTRKVPTAKKIPYEIKDIEWLTEDLCFVIGHFLAEGWAEKKGKAQTSGYDIPKHIIPILKSYQIPFTLYRNNSGVPCLNFLKSEFKEFLKTLKTSSFDIHIPETFFHLPESKLNKLIDGFYLGDGHCGIDAGTKNNSHREKVYSTSSDEFAVAIYRIYLQLGLPIHIWYQRDHKGAGNKPIWRLSYNSRSFFSREHGFDGLSEVGIKEIEQLPEVEMRDFEVEDTHIFVTKWGILSHNCEDQAFLIHSLCLNADIPYDRLKTFGGLVEAGETAPLGGHGWTVYQRETDNEWVPLDACYYFEDTPIADRIPLREDLKYVEDFFYITAVETRDATFQNYLRGRINIIA